MPPRAFGSAFGPAFGGPERFGTLALKVGSVAANPDGTPTYQDGDIVSVFNRRQTRRIHAEHICSPRQALRNGSGLILSTHHCRDWYERTHQFRFERVSATEVLRTNLVTLGQDLLSNTPNVAGERIDVALFIARRLAMPQHRLFGAPGAEVWYGGTINTSEAVLDQVWTAIETKTPLREIDHGDLPLAGQQLRSFLFVRCDDFNDTEADALVAPAVEGDPENPTLVHKRARRVQWRGLRDMTPGRVADIENRTVAVDIRNERKHVRAVTVEVK